MGSFKLATSDGAYLLQSGQTVADIHRFGAAAGRLCRFLLGKNCVEQTGSEKFPQNRVIADFRDRPDHTGSIC
jgi:hypothetical protein